MQLAPGHGVRPRCHAVRPKQHGSSGCTPCNSKLLITRTVEAVWIDPVQHTAELRPKIPNDPCKRQPS